MRPSYTEYLTAEAECLVDIAVVVRRLDVDSALSKSDLEIARKLQAHFKLSLEQLFKISAVKPLESELTVFTEQYFFHFYVPLRIFYIVY